MAPPDKGGKLAQGRDFPSKKAYDAKLSKQVKILRGKAENLRKKKQQAYSTRDGITSGSGRDLERSKSINKIGTRIKEREKTAKALERSLKRVGSKGPTSMLPVVSGKGADVEMPGMSDKKSKITYKQFYKDAGVSKREPIKPAKNIFKSPKKIKKKYSTINLSPKGKKFVKKVPKVFKNKTFAKIGKAALKNPYVAAGAAVVGTALAGYGAYKGIKALTNKPKTPSLRTSDLKPGGTVTYASGENKGKAVKFDALNFGGRRNVKPGVEKKKPTYKDFTSGKYIFK
tara:strand:- start:239 stop:1096 length:858 start_codon:yes stop_codon:yes gene_type:complete